MSKLNVTKSVTYDLITDEEGKTIALSNREDVTRLIEHGDEVKKCLIEYCKFETKEIGSIHEDVVCILEKLENKNIDEILNDIDPLKTRIRQFPNKYSTGIKSLGLTENDLTPVQYQVIIKYNKIVMNNQVVTQDNDLFTNKNIIIDNENKEIIVSNIYAQNGIKIMPGEYKVIIRGCLVKGGYYNIECLDGRDSIIIENCTITNDLEYHENSMKDENGNPRGHKENALARGKSILARNCIIRNCDISGSEDNIDVKSNVQILDNYLHDVYMYDPAWDNKTGGATHSDGIQCLGGSNIRIKGNHIDASYSNAAIIFGPAFGNIKDVVVENNYLVSKSSIVDGEFRGANYIMYVRTSPETNFIYENIAINNNIFSHNNEEHLLSYDVKEASFIENITDKGYSLL